MDNSDNPATPGIRKSLEMTFAAVARGAETGPVLVATSAFGLEAVIRREVEALGYSDISGSDGRVCFTAPVEAIPRCNLWLRSADRLFIRLGEFNAVTFEELFEGTKAQPWENWITRDGVFTVTGKSVKSTLGSVRACQSIVKKAIVERLKSKYHIEWFPETGAAFTVQISMLRDTATLSIDTSGEGLHKRGYRKTTVEAPIRETLAAGLISLSFWKSGRILMDPFCGSGTIPIEAALIGRNIAPGLGRRFASEEWPVIPAAAWKSARQEARDLIGPPLELKILASDREASCIEAGRENAESAKVGVDIEFSVKSLSEIWIDKQFGIVITNPPYGYRIGEFQDLNKTYLDFYRMFKKKSGWSIYVITGDTHFPRYFKKEPDRVRKLFNGKLEVTFFQFFGEKPPPEMGHDAYGDVILKK